MNCSTVLILIALIISLAACGDRGEPSGDNVSSTTTDQAAAVDQCAALADAPPANTTITRAERVDQGAFVAPTPEPFGPDPDFSGLPAFCRVAGSIAPTADSDIRFELWLPLEDWNGRFLQTGNGGASGALVYGSMIEPLARGYAVAHTDTGHRSGGGEFEWAVDQPEALVDYQYRAVHELTVAGKAMTESHYGRPPEKSYWTGCSSGGRQGLKEIQRYPQDYDAVIAGAPANNWSPLMSLSVHVERELERAPGLVAKLDLLRDAAVAACDAEDGVTDGVITSPDTCSFSPTALRCEGAADSQCLSEEEVAAASNIYAGVVNAQGQVLMPGTGPGSEREWAFYVSQVFRIGSNYYRNLVIKDPDWSAADFDVEQDLALAEAFDQNAAKAMDPDISAFTRRGGKLLLYHGTTDGLIPYQNTVNYYNAVMAELGDTTDNHVKLFLVPGMDHCFGGSGVYAIDWLGAMERWAEDNQAPSSIPGRNPGGEGQPEFSRPVCAYPDSPVYDGSGDRQQAGSFTCESIQALE